MTEKEKAEELVNELFERSLTYHDACIAAKYLVDEVIKEIEKVFTPKYAKLNSTYQYWQQVKEELKKL